MAQSILVTGGAGYVGSLLVPQLLDRGHKVRVFDTLYFGKSFLPLHNNRLEIIEGDLRDKTSVNDAMKSIDTVIHLGCISNDASFALNETLSTSINLDAFEPLVDAAKNKGVKRFIYASSSSVYGVSEAPDVTEEHPLVPLTLYNKYKGMCEPILFDYIDENFTGVVIRPATLCGYAPRQRLDLSVNILTCHAIVNDKITVFGGEQKRPNLHVQDMCDVYNLLLDVDSDKIQGEIFNVGFQNLKIIEIADMAKKIVSERFPDKNNIEIEVTPTDDLRSYHVNSDKITKVLGFKPKFSVEDAISDLCQAFQKGLLPNAMKDDIYYNVKRLINLKVS